MDYPECFGDMGHKICCFGYEPSAEAVGEEERAEASRKEAIACHACQVFEPCTKISLNTGLHGGELNLAERLSAIESALGGGEAGPGGLSRYH
jgi:hypothetical protein